MAFIPLFKDPDFLEFYITAKKATYAAGGNEKAVILPDGGRQYTFFGAPRWPRWKYTDIWYGKNPFMGNEVVEELDIESDLVRIIAQMAYSGAASGTPETVKAIFIHLKEALGMVSVNRPFRGPKIHPGDDLKYLCDFRVMPIPKDRPCRIIGTEEITLTKQRWNPDIFYQGNFMFCDLR